MVIKYNDMVLLNVEREREREQCWHLFVCLLLKDENNAMTLITPARMPIFLDVGGRPKLIYEAL